MSEQLALFGEPAAPMECADPGDPAEETLIPSWFTKHQDRLPASTPDPQFDGVEVQEWRQHVPQAMLLQVGPTTWRLSVAAPPAATIDIYLTEKQCKTIVKNWASKSHGAHVPLHGGEIGLAPFKPEISIRVFNKCGDIRQIIAGGLAEHTIDVIKSRTLKKVDKP